MLAPPGVPLTRDRRAVFSAVVTDAFDHLSTHTEEVLRLDVRVVDVPDRLPDYGPVPLGEIDRTHSPARLVIHRQPVLARVRHDPEDTRLLVRDLLAELAADVLCRDPHDVDPHYPRI